MKYMKIGLVLISMLILIVCLTGCDNNSKNNTNNTTTNTSNNEKNNKEKVDVESLDFVKSAEKQVAKPEKGETIATIHIKKYGDVKVKFFKDEAPKAVENFITHAKDGYYNGLTFHRIIDDFMILLPRLFIAFEKSLSVPPFQLKVICFSPTLYV